MAATLAALMHGGALVEVGKRGIWSPARVAQDRPDAAYHLVAVDFWRPATVAGSLLNLATNFAQGACSPPPCCFLTARSGPPCLGHAAPQAHALLSSRPGQSPVRPLAADPCAALCIRRVSSTAAPSLPIELSSRWAAAAGCRAAHWQGRRCSASPCSPHAGGEVACPGWPGCARAAERALAGFSRRVPIYTLAGNTFCTCTKS